MIRLRVKVVGICLKKRPKKFEENMKMDTISFLHFAKIGQTIGELRQNIQSQMSKMYPEETGYVISRIQDNKKYDLFDEYLVEDCVETNSVILAITSKSIPPMVAVAPVTPHLSTRPLLTPLSDTGSISSSMIAVEKDVHSKPEIRRAETGIFSKEAESFTVQKAKRPRKQDKLDRENQKDLSVSASNLETVEHSPSNLKMRGNRIRLVKPTEAKDAQVEVFTRIMSKEQGSDDIVQIFDTSDKNNLCPQVVHEIAHPLPIKRVEKSAKKAFEEIASIIEKSDSSSDEEPSSLHVPTVRSNSALSITSKGIRPSDIKEDSSDEESADKTRRPTLTELSKSLQQRRNSPEISNAVVETPKLNGNQ